VSRKKFAFETRSGALSPGMDRAVEAVVTAAFEGLKDAADLIFAESQGQVPILEGPEQLKRAGASDPGELKRSGDVTMEPENLRAAIAYKTVYASLQHERMDYNHPSGGNAKFLERPLLENRERSMEIVAAKIRKATAS
jgi:hypothetical protein